MQSLLRGLAARSAAGASASAIGGVAAQRHVSLHSRGHASVRCRAGKRESKQRLALQRISLSIWWSAGACHFTESGGLIRIRGIAWGVPIAEGANEAI